MNRRIIDWAGALTLAAALTLPTANADAAPAAICNIEAGFAGAIVDLRDNGRPASVAFGTIGTLDNITTKEAAYWGWIVGVVYSHENWTKAHILKLYREGCAMRPGGAM